MRSAQWDAPTKRIDGLLENWEFDRWWVAP